jgi:Protein of unknown function (DUF5132)
MALLDKETRNMLVGMGLGAGAVLAARYVAPVLGAVARPLTKALIARSMDGFEQATRRLASAAEHFQDLVAEVRAERGVPVAEAVVEQAVKPNPGAN